MITVKCTLPIALGHFTFERTRSDSLWHHNVLHWLSLWTNTYILVQKQCNAAGLALPTFYSAFAPIGAHSKSPRCKSFTVEESWRNQDPGQNVRLKPNCHNWPNCVITTWCDTQGPIRGFSSHSPCETTLFKYPNIIHSVQ